MTKNSIVGRTISESQDTSALKDLEINEIRQTQKPVNNTEFKFAAIYVSEDYKKEASISKQVHACESFLKSQGLIFSGDMFLKKEGTEYIDKLSRARAWSRRFDFLVSYTLCRGKGQGYFIGLIACWNVNNFLNFPKEKIVLEG